jgi:hypothetical protein
MVQDILRDKPWNVGSWAKVFDSTMLEDIVRDIIDCREQDFWFGHGASYL